MDQKLLYYVVPSDSFSAEGRVFYKDQKYPVYDNSGFSILVGENGEFNFSNDLMRKVIEEWDLTVVDNAYFFERGV